MCIRDRSGTVAQEMIALALTQTYCAEVGEDASPWLSLKEGFFVPLDDVPELFRGVGDKKDKEESGQRADLLYVSASRKVGLRFGFVEVKFRRYLKTARSMDLLTTDTRIGLTYLQAQSGPSSASASALVRWIVPGACLGAV